MVRTQTTQLGDSLSLAEFIVDYKKKTIKIKDLKRRHKITKADFLFQFTPFYIMIFGTFWMTIFGFSQLFPHIISSYDFLWLLGSSFIIYFLMTIFPAVRKKIHYLEQILFNDKFQKKIFLKVENLKTRTWILPREYRFTNHFLKYRLYGEFKPLIEKVHIKPWDYKIKTPLGLTNQNDDFDVIFTFIKVPKTGRMELEFF